MEFPKTLMQAVTYFSDPQVSHEFMVDMRWPGGVRCPHCGHGEQYWIGTRRVWRCKSKACGKQFSVKSGTIFEDSPLPLDKWLLCVWLMVNAKNGISSYEIGRALGVTQKSAWFMGHRVRHALRVGSFDKLDGDVEADETFIGGKAGKMHKARRALALSAKRGPAGKAIVAGVVERGGEVRAEVLPAVSSRLVREHVEPGSNVYTDESRVYDNLGDGYRHATVNHSEGQYVDGPAHTQNIDNFWSLFKRCLKGTHVSVEPEHLQRYVDEEAYRYNERKGKDAGRFTAATGRVDGKRITYKNLTAVRAGRGPAKGSDWRTASPGKAGA